MILSELVNFKITIGRKFRNRLRHNNWENSRHVLYEVKVNYYSISTNRQAAYFEIKISSC